MSSLRYGFDFDTGSYNILFKDLIGVIMFLTQDMERFEKENPNLTLDFFIDHALIGLSSPTNSNKIDVDVYLDCDVKGFNLK